MKLFLPMNTPPLTETQTTFVRRGALSETRLHRFPTFSLLPKILGTSRT